MQQKDDRDLSVIISELVNDEDDVQKNKIISDRLYPLSDMYDVSRPDVIIQLFLENMECDDIIVLINGDPSKSKTENKKILMAKVLEAQESLNEDRKEEKEKEESTDSGTPGMSIGGTT